MRSSLPCIQVAAALSILGRKALAAGDVETACARFHASQRLDPAPGTEANIGDCEERRGNIATAWEMNRTALGHLAPDDPRRSILKRRIEKLEPRLPKLVLALGQGADKDTIVRDGDTTIGAAGSYGTALPLDPGVHHLVATAPGCAPRTIDVRLVEGKTETVSLGPCPAAGTSTAGPWIIGGVGLAALVVGAVTGGLTVSKKSAVDAAHCTDGPPPRCPTQAGIDAASAGRTFGYVTTASLIAGSAAVAAGAIWLDAHSAGALRLVRYDMGGNFSGATTVGPPCASGGYGRALGVRTQTGGVVVGCQDTTGKRYYRRFSSTLNPLDEIPQPLPELDAVADASATSVTGYLIDYDSAEDLVFVADPGSGSWPAIFLDAGLAKVGVTIPGVSTLSNDRILTSPNGDFLLPVQTSATNFQEYGPKGTSAGKSWNLDGALFRVDACNRVYALAGVTLARQPAPW